MAGEIDKTGVMIHHVISEVDMGQPILVKEILFIKGVDEDFEVFKQRVHEIEWGVVVEGVGIMIKQIHEEKRTEGSL
jgi:phosphoribosylglycinamide formyltransferase